MGEQLADNLPNMQTAHPVAQRLTEGLQHLGMEQLDTAQANNLLQHATLRQAREGIDYLNAAVLGTVERPDHSQTTSSVSRMVDGKEVVGQMLLAPRHRDEFLDHTMRTIRSTEDVTRRANLAAFGIVLGHFERDGNGRSARVAHEVITNGFDPNSEASVQAIAAASASRDELRAQGASTIPISFAPSNELRRAWVGETIQREGVAESFVAKRTQIEGQFSSLDQHGMPYPDPEKIEGALSGIGNGELKSRVRKTVQQVDFGPRAAVDICAVAGTEDLGEAFAKLDEAGAQQVIAADDERKLAFSKRVIDVAAGAELPYYAKPETPPAPDFMLNAENALMGYH
ncbi:MAG TPA: hypothetical protein VLG11_03845 [Candidatus Saccharimonadales bacterium]|nr:hypothetical protein [Candidatus Saccharimonadales bacterium]